MQFMRWLCGVPALAMATLLGAYPRKGRSQEGIWYMDGASASTILRVLIVRPVKIFTMTYLGNLLETKPMLAKVRILFSILAVFKLSD